jgi:hypothetical protein
MGRPRKWASDAERKAAERSGAEPEELEPRLPELPVGRAAPPVEEYVALQLAITRAELAARRDRGGRERPADAADIDEAGRLARTEAYARYRHAGFVAGEIASL